MRIAVLSELYPSPEKPDQRAFVHARTQLYKQAGHDLRVFAEPEGVEASAYQLDGVLVTRCAAGDLVTALRSFDPDVVAYHTPYAGTSVFRVANEIIGAYPIVAWVHGYEAMYTAFLGYHHGWRRWASIPWDVRKLWRLRQFLQKCAGIVFVSQWLRTVAERGMLFRHPRTWVIHNPVDLTLFPAKSMGASEPLSRQPRGIALRSLGPKYGLDIAVQAYAELPDTSLTIVGTGPLEGELRKLIAETHSNTQLEARALPHRSVPDLLREYDYFVAPSRNETQGLAMCEAMACGLPVAATWVGGIPEFVRDGVDGYLVPPESSVQLRAAIHKLVSDPDRMQVMGKNAREQIGALCDGQVIAEHEMEVLGCAWRSGQ